MTCHVMEKKHFLRLASLKFGGKTDVLFYLLGTLNFKNYVPLNQQEIADFLEMDRSNVNKYIRHLEKIGLIIKGTKVKQNYSYKLSRSLLNDKKIA